MLPLLKSIFLVASLIILTFHNCITSLITLFPRNISKLKRKSFPIIQMLSYERFKDIDTYESESSLFDTKVLNTMASKAL